MQLLENRLESYEADNYVEPGAEEEDAYSDDESSVCGTANMPQHQSSLLTSETKPQGRASTKKSKAGKKQQHARRYGNTPPPHSFVGSSFAALIDCCYLLRLEKGKPLNRIVLEAVHSSGAADSNSGAPPDLNRLTFLHPKQGMSAKVDAPNYLSVAAAPSKVPARKLCSVCGYPCLHPLLHAVSCSCCVSACVHSLPVLDCPIPLLPLLLHIQELVHMLQV